MKTKHISTNYELVYFILAAIILLSGCSSSRNLSSSRIDKERTSLIQFSKQYRGVPYRYGGATPKGFDCSGFVGYVFSNFGYKLPRSSDDMMKAGRKVSEKKAEIGDLIFFKGRNTKSKKAGHVGIITEIRPSGEIYFIHASTSSGIVISSKNSSYYKSRFLRIKRIIG